MQHRQTAKRGATYNIRGIHNMGIEEQTTTPEEDPKRAKYITGRLVKYKQITTLEEGQSKGVEGSTTTSEEEHKMSKLQHRQKRK